MVWCRDVRRLPKSGMHPFGSVTNGFVRSGNPYLLSIVVGCYCFRSNLGFDVSMFGV